MTDPVRPEAAPSPDAGGGLDPESASALAWLCLLFGGLGVVKLVVLHVGHLLDEPRALVEGLSPEVLGFGVGLWSLAAARRRAWARHLGRTLAVLAPLLVLCDVGLVVAMLESGATPRLAYLDAGMIDLVGPAVAQFLTRSWSVLLVGAALSVGLGVVVHRAASWGARRLGPRWLLPGALGAVLLAGWPFALAVGSPAYGARAMGPLVAVGLEAIGLDPLVRVAPMIPLEGAAPHAPPRPAGLRPGADELLERAQGRSVVLVVGESLTAVDLGPDGGPVAMPTLARWVERGLLAERAYTHHNYSSQALAAILAGVHPKPFAASHGPYLRHRGPALARRFREAGYRTLLAFSGRCAEGSRWLAEGLDDFDAIVETPHLTGRSADADLIAHLDTWLDEGEPGRPFLAVLWTVETHAPYGYWTFRGEPPPPDAPEDDRERYRLSIAELDRHLAALEALLRRRERWDETVVALTGDHGEGFGVGHPLNVNHGCAFYEANARVPLVLTGEGLFDAPLRDPRPVQLKDVAATLAHLVLGDPPVFGEGLSLLVERDRAGAAFMLNEVGYAVVAGRYKLQRRLLLAPPGVELYDLEADPGETRDLAGEEPETVERLDALFRDWYADWYRRR